MCCMIPLASLFFYFIGSMFLITKQEDLENGRNNSEKINIILILLSDFVV